MSQCPCAIATVHLESLNSAHTRSKQLAVASKEMDKYERVVLCGDFNFDSTQNFGDWRALPPRPPRPLPPRYDSSDEEEAYVGPVKTSIVLENEVLGTNLLDYVDAWPALHPDEHGHTFDGSCNPHVADPQETMRYDRVMVRGARPTSINIMGKAGAARTEYAEDATASSSASDPVVVPSDHFGLCAEVAWN